MSAVPILVVSSTFFALYGQKLLPLPEIVAEQVTKHVVPIEGNLTSLKSQLNIHSQQLNDGIKVVNNGINNNAQQIEDNINQNRAIYY